VAATAVLLALLVGAVLGAAAQDPPTLDQYRPRDRAAVIKTVSLSASDRNRFDARRVGTEFPASVTHVVVWYRWEGAPPGHRVDIHWYLEGARILEQGEAIGKATGSEAWVLQTSGGPLPAGSYRVDLLEGSKAVTTIPFRVGGKPDRVVALDQYRPRVAGAVVKAVSLSASDGDEFDAARVGTAFPAGVPRVVVHYLWEGAKPGHRIEARWLGAGGVVGQKAFTLTTAIGFGVFSVGPLPVGHYRVEILENGKPVTTIPFRVGAPGG